MHSGDRDRGPTSDAGLVSVAIICLCCEVHMEEERVNLSNHGQLAGARDVAFPGSSVVKHWLRLLRAPSSILGWDVWRLFRFGKKRPHIPIPLTFPFPFSFRPNA